MAGREMLAPMLALIGWTFVMWVWLYATRIPAIQKARLNFEQMRKTGEKLSLPPEVSRVADNYAHLHEQPTIFYALALAAQIAGAVDLASIWLAWIYVALRVVHSLIQATVNVIPLRFVVFNAGAIALLALFFRTLWLLFSAG